MVCASADGSTCRAKSFRRLASTRGFKRPCIIDDDIGWIRVYEGPKPFAVNDSSRLLKVNVNTSVKTVRAELGLNEDTIWLQIGNGDISRLADSESPLQIQENVLARCGWEDENRRSRLAIDLDLKFIYRFSVGPGAGRGGGKASGSLLVLKGLVFPHWKPRFAALLGQKLFIFSVSSPVSEPEQYDIRGSSVEVCEPKGRKLVLSLSSKDHTIFLGFNNYCDRNIWFSWLKEGSESRQPSDTLDLSCAGLDSVQLIFDSNSWFRCRMRTLCLSRNRLQKVPEQVWLLTDLVVLDLSENCIRELPAEISKLERLEELTVSNNELERLENCLRLPKLKILRAFNNVVSETFMTENETNMNSVENSSESRTPLTSVDLRNNRLKGSIILGNYEHLSVLDVSDNAIEVLVVSALRGLRELHSANNALGHLAVHGAALRFLNASFNQLENIVTTVPPSNLIHINVSHNKFSQLPSWICSCADLTTLHASFNQLTELPNDIFNQTTRLHSLRLAHNRISSLPTIDNPCHFEELLLHDNSLHSLPESFFVFCDSVKVINLTSNRLNRLPPAKKTQQYCLERLYLTSNCLDDTVYEVLKEFQQLKLLHLSYNCLTQLPEACCRFWPDMEEIEISRNNLQCLPNVIAKFQSLKILRAHSNRLRTAPLFASSKSLKLLDLSHNELEEIKLETLAPKQLKFLDISCNKKSQVDPMHFQAYRCQRPMSLVDVTGQVKSPISWLKKPAFEENSSLNPWSVGFTESPGSNLRLTVSQIRMPTFCNKEGLFAIIDGEGDDEVPKLLQNTLPGLLLEEKSIKETADKYMKYLVLSAHRELKEKGQRKGACLLACHITPIAAVDNGFGPIPKRYSIKLANVGNTKSVFCKKTGYLSIGSESHNRVGYTTRYSDVLPDPEVAQSVVGEDDEFVVLGNKGLWKEMNVDFVVKEVKNESNPILAAKRLQDLAHSFGVEDCLSVVVVKFDRIRNDVDVLMNELRHTIRKNKCRNEICCVRSGACVHSATPPKSVSDRSSPSGQSDRNAWECANNNVQNTNVNYSSVRSNGISSRQSDIRNYRGAVARAVRVRVEDERERCGDDSALSEEQFKCWEYMLEQNTQLLFDKELDTISKGYTRSARMNGLRNLKGLSGSSPQLHLTGNTNPIVKIGTPFLSKHFGSARNFGVGFKPDIRLSSARIPNTGPNAAYFGSLQRLMPYHLEYDFDVIQEKHLSEDSIDLEGRMQQYWGVTTTEL